MAGVLMGGQAVLLAVAPDGQRWEDPSEDLLFMLLEDLVEAGRGSLRVERLDSAGAEVLEIFHRVDLFRVRRQEGAQVATARSRNLHEVHAAATRWAFRVDSEAAAQSQQWTREGFDGTLGWRIAPGEASTPADGAG